MSYWNILWGFPAEPPEEYERMAKLIQFLTHLSPPMALRDRWNEVNSRSYLCSFDDGKRLFIWDERPVAVERLSIITDVQRLVYAECDASTDMKKLSRKIEDYTGDKWKKKDIEQLIEPLVSAGLMFREGDKYLSLAIPAGDHYPPSEVKQQFENYLVELKERNRQKDLTGRIKLTGLPEGTKISADEIKNLRRTRLS